MVATHAGVLRMTLNKQSVQSAIALSKARPPAWTKNLSQSHAPLAVQYGTTAAMNANARMIRTMLWFAQQKRVSFRANPCVLMPAPIPRRVRVGAQSGTMAAMIANARKMPTRKWFALN
jgi:hypothetical protein